MPRTCLNHTEANIAMRGEIMVLAGQGLVDELGAAKKHFLVVGNMQDLKITRQNPRGERRIGKN